MCLGLAYGLGQLKTFISWCKNLGTGTGVGEKDLRMALNLR